MLLQTTLLRLEDFLDPSYHSSVSRASSHLKSPSKSSPYFCWTYLFSSSFSYPFIPTRPRKPTHLSRKTPYRHRLLQIELKTLREHIKDLLPHCTAIVRFIVGGGGPAETFRKLLGIPDFSFARCPYINDPITLYVRLFVYNNFIIYLVLFKRIR